MAIGSGMVFKEFVMAIVGFTGGILGSVKQGIHSLHSRAVAEPDSNALLDRELFEDDILQTGKDIN
jgi:hypothetical protein